MGSISQWSCPDTANRPVAVIGGGVLGRRLCMMWAAAGHNVVLYEKQQNVLQAALDYIRPTTPQQAAQVGREVPGTVEAAETLESAVHNAWMVIEAIPEILELKVNLFAELDRLAPPDCILATNSSSYRSREIAVRVERKDRVCNTHYYMPPEKNYVEIMTCGETSEELMAFLMDQATSAGFLAIHAKVESTGLIFNRVWAAIKRECLQVMTDGVGTADDIDLMFKGWFHADIGPSEMMDRVGLDTVYNIEKHYIEERGLGCQANEWLKKEFIDKGNLGYKSGKGLTLN
ncbi:hypothetical protein FE257_011451 [Aspergillus nanangensis]|uniref:3-hydroxyacyl-CoA dehydrogenase n=1 Tax=Aspergillus nanangensis TaxID=2582783 RepID=A0AAD4CH72_ASPNN|nr:hypothetical protein FE257_011451 [Aspergillus nanangensis]